jgi:hypothetical protein
VFFDVIDMSAGLIAARRVVTSVVFRSREMQTDSLLGKNEACRVVRYLSRNGPTSFVGIGAVRRSTGKQALLAAHS